MQYNYYDKLDAVGKRAYNAISLAYNKYGCSKGFVSTLNLWGSKLAKSLSKSFSLNFENAFIVNSFSNICTMYSTSIEWVFGKNN